HAQLAAERRVQDVDEARAAVGHRRQVELVVRRPAAPALGDRLGRLDRGQGAGELVGCHEDAHAPHPARRAGRRSVAPGESDLDLVIRPMRTDDVPVAERLSAEAFLDVDRRTLPRSAPDPQPRPPERAESWVTRTRHFLVTDPGGCWVAEGADGTMVGFAT